LLTVAQLLEPLARHRTDQVVVTTMSVVRPWGRLSSHPLDFASADSAMGHAADLALGIALARPGRGVVCLNGDGSMLMSLGTLATVVGTGAANYMLYVADNGAFEITGHQPVAGSGRLDHAALAEAAGFRNVFRFDDARSYALSIEDVLRAPGPTFVHALVEPGRENPLSRGDDDEPPYLRPSLAESARAVRAALASARPGSARPV
jgi:thiamine pyrophosphate-dependent acetolactate synthase large subunit-like protein